MDNKTNTGMDTDEKGMSSEEMTVKINQYYYELIQKGVSNFTIAEIETVEKYIDLIQFLISSRKRQLAFIEEIEQFCEKGESVK
jgi:hypothetical protein